MTVHKGEPLERDDEWGRRGQRNVTQIYNDVIIKFIVSKFITVIMKTMGVILILQLLLLLLPLFCPLLTRPVILRDFLFNVTTNCTLNEEK